MSGGLGGCVARRVGNDELPVSLLGGTSHMATFLRNALSLP